MLMVSTDQTLEAALLVANTAHGPGGHRGARTRATAPRHDHLAAPEAARTFLADHAITVPAELPGPSHLARLRRLRHVAEAAAAGEPTFVDELDALLAAVPMRVDAGGTLRTTRSGWDAVVDELTLPLLELPGIRDRLRRCGNASCGWLFVDRSRNRSRVWCDMSACGNREKGRRHRHRR